MDNFSAEDFYCPISDAVHSAGPRRWLCCFQTFRDVFLPGHLFRKPGYLFSSAYSARNCYEIHRALRSADSSMLFVMISSL